MFTGIIISSVVGINSKNKNLTNNNIKPISKIYSVLIVFGFSLITFVIVDCFSFIIDDSISKDYAQTLLNMAAENEESLEGAELFASLPFSIQNFLSTFILGFIGSLISLLFIRKNGKLI